MVMDIDYEYYLIVTINKDHASCLLEESHGDIIT